MSTSCGWESNYLFRLRMNVWMCREKTVRSLENTCHTWALLAVVFHYEEVLYQVYAPLPLPFPSSSLSPPHNLSRGSGRALWPSPGGPGGATAANTFYAFKKTVLTPENLVTTALVIIHVGHIIMIRTINCPMSISPSLFSGGGGGCGMSPPFLGFQRRLSGLWNSLPQFSSVIICLFLNRCIKLFV